MDQPGGTGICLDQYGHDRVAHKIEDQIHTDQIEVGNSGYRCRRRLLQAGDDLCHIYADPLSAAAGELAQGLSQFNRSPAVMETCRCQG
ncbi:uncharacterized protein METZ01_LOCUS322489, partial [marine metagenome]